MSKKRKITEIYDAALTVFAEFGYKKATLADIAAELNMTGAGLYRYFVGKQDLYERSVGYALLQWQAYAREAISPDADVRTQFTMMCLKAVEYLSINATFRQLLVRDPEIFPVFPDKDPYEKINRSSLELIRSILKRGIDSGEFRDTNLELTADLLWTIYKTFIVRIYVKDRGEASHESWKVFVELITNGLFTRDL